MYKIRFILLLLLALIFAHYQTMVYAGNRANALAFTLGGGYDYFSSTRHLSNTGFPFIALGYHFTEALGVEAVFSKFTTESRRSEDAGSTVHGGFYLLDGIYHFKNNSRVEPFLLAGVGVTHFNPNGSDANNVGNVNVGAGLQLFFDPSLAFRIETRDLMTTAGGKQDILLDAGVTFLLDVC